MPPFVVSILVLVDESFEVVTEEAYDWLEREFQSLFSWMNRSKPDIIHEDKHVFKFQSLFSWMNRSKEDIKDGC